VPLLQPSSRDKILDVAEDLFARRGFAGVGMREVADRVGLGKSSLFHHFRGKTQLYFEVLARILDRIRLRLEPALREDTGTLERLDRGLDALVDALAEHPATARLLLRALFEDDEFPAEPGLEAERAERILEDLLESIRRVLRQGMEQGALRRASVAHTLQTLIGATVYHFASGEFGDTLLGRPVLSAEAVAARKQELRDLLRHGLAARPGQPKGEPPWTS
jgi:AcrR family transcriptional regulator